jgi:predicted regulator of Ras-like GTPase activity (Roadblock/LC7/MglB family)
MATLTESLNDLMTTDGVMCAAVVDYNSGMLLGGVGSGLDLEIAAAGNTEVVRAKMKVAKMLGLPGAIEDMLITLSTQYHVIRPCAKLDGLFIYLVLDKTRSNLAMARRKVLEVEAKLAI